METSGFVQDKLTEWGFSEFMQRFKGMSLLLFFNGNCCICNGTRTASKFTDSEVGLDIPVIYDL